MCVGTTLKTSYSKSFIMENRDHDIRVEDVFEALNILLMPHCKSGGKTIELAKDPFLRYLQDNLDALNMRLSDQLFLSLAAALKDRLVKTNVPGTASEWLYVNHILQLLSLLTRTLLQSREEESNETTDQDRMSHKDGKPKRPQDAPPLTSNVLSISQLTCVKKALQFVVCLGVCPNLAPGVGIPLKHRSKLITLAPLDGAALSDISQSLESNKLRLSVCVSVLGEMVKIPDLRSVLVSSHLNDLLAALLQLLYVSNEASQRKDVEPVPVSQTTDSSNGVQSHSLLQSNSVDKPSTDVRPDCVSVSPADIEVTDKVDSETSATSEGRASSDCRHSYKETSAGCEGREASDCLGSHMEVMERVISSVRADLLIRELLVLQSGVPKQIQMARNPGATVSVPPIWLRKACSQLLFRLATRPQGITHLYQAISAGSDPNSPSTWRHCGAVAKIMSRHPVHAGKLDQYLSSVSQQLTELLETEGKENEKFIRLLGAVSSAMTTKYGEGFYRHFHRPLLQPLFRCLDTGEEKMDGTVALTERELARCLQKLYKVHIVGQAPQSDSVRAMEGVVPVLWILFCLTCSTVYSIKRQVRGLLVSYLKCLGQTEGAVCLRDLCARGQGQGRGGERSLVVRWQAGGEGGMMALYGHPDKITNLTDSQQVSGVIDLLQDLKTDGTAGHLLVLLLKEMTEMITQESQQTDIVLPASVLRSEVRGERGEELLRRVILLHLLASICETFGSECLSDTSQILLFVKASLERGVVVCGGTREEEMAVFETETMSMAMGLLTAVMSGAVKMKEEEKVLMDDMLPLLEVIGQGHPDEFMREMASDIRIAIATRGAVWSALQQNMAGRKKDGHTETKVTSVQNPQEEASKMSKRTKPSDHILDISLAGSTTRSAHKQTLSKPLIEVLSSQASLNTQNTEQGRQSSLQTTLPSKSLIDVLSDQPSANTQNIEQGRQSSPQTTLPSKSLIDVLSDQPSANTQNIEHGRQSSPQTTLSSNPLVETVSSKILSKSEMPASKDESSLSEIDTVSNEENTKYSRSVSSLDQTLESKKQTSSDSFVNRSLETEPSALQTESNQTSESSPPQTVSDKQTPSESVNQASDSDLLPLHVMLEELQDAEYPPSSKQCLKNLTPSASSLKRATESEHSPLQAECGGLSDAQHLPSSKQALQSEKQTSSSSSVNQSSESKSSTLQEESEEFCERQNQPSSSSSLNYLPESKSSALQAESEQRDGTQNLAASATSLNQKDYAPQSESEELDKTQNYLPDSNSCTLQAELQQLVETDHQPASASSVNDHPDSKSSALQSVFEELCDPLLPVRGHALISLTRLIQDRDRDTLDHRNVVLTVFEENLRHGDSYIYLAAINGLSALSDRFPESVLPALVKEFTGATRSEVRLSAEHRLKVGEALMKATRNLGEMIPKYRELLLGAVLAGARDHDATVRASSVSNLAEVCSLLRFSLGSVLHEVLHCCSSLLETDEVIVRRAAALTLTKTLEGLGSDCFIVLESVLPGLYRLLRKVERVDRDEGVRLHAGLALTQLDSLARAFAFPPQTLQKTIQVLPNQDTFR